MNDNISDTPPIHKFVEARISPEAIVRWWTLSHDQKNDIIVRAFAMVRHVCNAHTFEGVSPEDIPDEFNRQVIENVERMCLK